MTKKPDGRRSWQLYVIAAIIVIGMSGCGENHAHRKRAQSLDEFAHLNAYRLSGKEGSYEQGHAVGTSLDVTGPLRITKRAPGALTEEGRLSGSVQASLLLAIDTKTGTITHFLLSAHDGTLRGVAPLDSYELSGSSLYVENIATSVEGTGAFLHVRPGTARLKGILGIASRTITATVVAKFSDE